MRNSKSLDSKSLDLKSLDSKSIWFTTLVAGVGAFVSFSASAVPSGFGMVPYWGDQPSTYSGQIPKGAYAVINPDSGALDLSASVVSNYKAIIKNIRAQGGKVLGYVPTGYAQLTPAEKTRYKNVGANLKAYANTLGGVDGYFFDEAVHEDDSDKNSISDPTKCAKTPPKWSAIRSTMASSGVSGTVVWNAGYAGDNQCFVAAAKRDEHVVILEASYAEYKKNAKQLNGATQSKANGLGVHTWVLVYGATQSDMKVTLNDTAANYVYVTNVAEDKKQKWGGAIWNTAPSYEPIRMFVCEA